MLVLLRFHHHWLLVCHYYLRINYWNRLGSTPIDLLSYKTLLLNSSHRILNSLRYSACLIKKHLQENRLINLSLTNGTCTSIFWEYLEELVNWLSFISLIMIIRTMSLLTSICSLTASMHFIIIRVILLFFPTMRTLTSIFVFASISISLYKAFCFPLATLVLIIIKDMRLSPKILPVMSIHANISSMGSITIWTPYCFEMKHIEIRVSSVKFIQ